jgi:hypothetical protein
MWKSRINRDKVRVDKTAHGIVPTDPMGGITAAHFYVSKKFSILW